MNVLTMDKVLEANPALREQTDAVTTVHHCMMEISNAIRKDKDAAMYYLQENGILIANANRSLRRKRK